MVLPPPPSQSALDKCHGAVTPANCHCCQHTTQMDNLKSTAKLPGNAVHHRWVTLGDLEPLALHYVSHSSSGAHTTTDPNFAVTGMTECEASPVPVREGRQGEEALVSTGATVPLSSTKNTFPQWLGTSNVDNFLLKSQTGAKIPPRGTNHQTYFALNPHPLPHGVTEQHLSTPLATVQATPPRAPAQRKAPEEWHQQCVSRPELPLPCKTLRLCLMYLCHGALGGQAFFDQTKSDVLM